MTKMYILYKDGRLYHDHIGKHGLTWAKVNNVHANHVYKEQGDFLKQYGLKTTIYNVGNLQKYGKIVLPEPIAKKLIKKHNLTVRV